MRYSKSFNRIRILIGLCLIVNQGIGQTSDPYPYASDVVKFDIVTSRADKAIPFDKPFVLIVENINTDGFIRASIIRTKSNAGNRELYPDIKDGSNLDFVFEKHQIVREKNKLTLLVPALRPSVDFDILIEKKLSTRSIERAHVLDKLIFDNSMNPAAYGFQWPQNAKDAFRSLRDSANNNRFKPSRDVFVVTGLDEYFNNVYSKYSSNYSNIVNHTGLVTTATHGAGLVFFSTAEMGLIGTAGPAAKKAFNDVFIIQQVEKESAFDDIMRGLRAMGYQPGSAPADPDEFEKRISNLSASVLFFDSLYRTMNELTAINASNGSCRDHVKMILDLLLKNRKTLGDENKAITAVLSRYKEAIWLIGTTHSKDLQTKSSSIFTLDAGFTGIRVRNLDNKIVFIPKLYWGVNIYFRGTDKNIRAKYVPKKKKPGNVLSENEQQYCDYDVLTKKSIWTHLCLTIGFTFGSLDKQNFDNFFAGSSMLIGPSLRLTRSFRVSAGAVFLKRAELNPLLSDKKIVVGGFAGLSLDFDILHAIKSVSGMLFK